MFIDVHCHLTGEEYAEIGGVEGVLARAKENGVGIVVCSGFDLDSSIIAKDFQFVNCFLKFFSIFFIFLQ